MRCRGVLCEDGRAVDGEQRDGAASGEGFQDFDLGAAAFVDGGDGEGAAGVFVGQIIDEAYGLHAGDSGPAGFHGVGHVAADDAEDGGRFGGADFGPDGGDETIDAVLVHFGDVVADRDDGLARRRGRQGIGKAVA